MGRISDWINRQRHNRGYGVQSPSSFFFVTQVLKERLPYYAYPILEEIAKEEKNSAKRLKELFRITKPGRLVSFHCMNLPTTKERDGFIGIRDFRGVPNRGFDGRGNYTLGIKEHTIFPELVESSAHSGMDITFVTSSTDNKACKELLVSMGMPFAGRN